MRVPRFQSVKINPCETTEKGVYQRWIEREQSWELSDPSTPMFRGETVTDGVLLMSGKYLPEGLLPQEADVEADGALPNVYPAFVSRATVLADHHALFLYLYTVRQITMLGGTK